MSKKVVILSIDGGGIRGIIPGVILEFIEQEIRRREGDKKRLSDYFDMIAGTSTGGILTALYLLPDGNATRYTATEAVNLYFENGPDIFSLSVWNKIRSLGGLSDEKYPAGALEKALEKYLGNGMLSDLRKPCLITAYDIEKRKAVFFNSADALISPVKNFKIRDVLRATSAAPTYFEPAYIYASDGGGYALIDGGVFANNPSMCAYAEARTIDFSFSGKAARPTASEMLIISIGTGSQSMARRQPYPYKVFKDAGKIRWITPVIDIMMSGNSETVDYQLRKLYDALPASDTVDYHRLEPELGLASPEMDDARAENMEALRQAGKAFIAENLSELHSIVTKLITHASIQDDLVV